MILIRQNNWNNNSFVSHFYEYYKKTEKDTLRVMGAIKIIQAEAIENKTELPSKFEELDKTKFFSRGFPQFIASTNLLGDFKKIVVMENKY